MNKDKQSPKPKAKPAEPESEATIPTAPASPAALSGMASAPPDDFAVKFVKTADELLEQLKQSNSIMEAAHMERLAHNQCLLGIDICQCRIATTWRANQAAIEKAEGAK